MLEKECDEIVVAQGIRENLPDAKLGPGNFTITLDSGQSANLKEFLGYIETEASPGVSVDFISASVYVRSTSTGMNDTPAGITGKKLNYMQDLKDLYGDTVLADAQYYIDEWGIAGSSEESGIFGTAHLFQAACLFLDSGITKVQHWKTYEIISSAGNKVLFDGESSLYTFFDYCRGWDASIYYLDSLLVNDVTGMGMVVKGPAETIIILSAVHQDRTVKSTQNFTFSFNKSDASFDAAAGVNKEYLSLDQSTSVYDIARDNLSARGLLSPYYAEQSDRVDRISKMGGQAARDYISNHWSTYTDAYVHSMTLSHYAGQLSETGDQFELEVSGMKTPSIMVFRLSNP